MEDNSAFGTVPSVPGFEKMMSSQDKAVMQTSNDALITKV